jgi:hypothetical protein
MNAPSAWAVAKRDAPRNAENCWSNLDLLRLREQLMDGTEVARLISCLARSMRSRATRTSRPTNPPDDVPYIIGYKQRTGLVYDDADWPAPSLATLTHKPCQYVLWWP